MFEAAELGRKVSSKEFKSAEPELRWRLLQAQRDLLDNPFPVIVIVSGAEGAGKGEVVHRLNEWLDPRGVDTHAFWSSSKEEREQPDYWRFWKALPVRGRISIMFGSWYTRPIIDRVQDRIEADDLDRAMHRVVSFERLLINDGALIVKLWFHLSKEEQKKRLKKLEEKPRTRWRVTPLDWEFHKNFDQFVEVSESALSLTDTGRAPWHLIEATDRRYRELTAARLLLEQLEARLKTPSTPVDEEQPETSQATLSSDAVTILDRVDLGQNLTPEKYPERLSRFQAKLGRLAWKCQEQQVTRLLVFEGWDASGKGGVIRRVTAAVDPRLYRVIPVASPTEEELAHHYLWRFWRNLPRPGILAIFDRSWYGRVLVERVEGFASTRQWERAFMEINDFEEQLVQHGIVLTKFWLHISGQEQLRRFREREKTPHKQHKITTEDWRNRERRDAYREAVNEMVARTSTGAAPWTLIPAECKRYGRVEVLKILCRKWKGALGK